jgi:hypothetical protein
MTLGSNGVDRVRSMQKIPTRLRSTSLCINCTSLARFAHNFVQYRNGPKHEFGVQWGGSGSFVAKNFDATLLHELVH